MRRASVGLATCLLIVSATGAAARPPDREPAPSDPLQFLAGEVCPFPVLLEVPFNRQTIKTFYDRAGSVRATTVTGAASSLATNLDTGESLLIRGGGHVSLGGDSDTFIIDASGVTSFYFLDGDVNPIGTGSGLFGVFGNVHEELDLNSGFVTTFEHSGRVIDVCAALSPD